MSGLADGTRIVITGNPTVEEVAAVVVAVNATRPTASTPAPRLAWQVAARAEGAGGPLISSPWELPPA